MDSLTLEPAAWPAPAKLNLMLRIVGRRADGYHLLQTVFQFLDCCDWLWFSPREDGRIERVGEVAGVPPDADLTVRAARLLQQATAQRAGATIRIAKQLPLGGGLGGGSSDAATVLVALNQLWGTAVPVDELAHLGLALGADVPVFVRGEAAWAEGVGEILTPCPAEEGPVLVITPDCNVETRVVFSDLELTRDTPPITMPAFSWTSTGNDCEPVTRRLYPDVGRALDWLSQRAPARMSGTGASVYALFDSDAAADAVARQVPPAWRHFRARRVNRSPLADRLAAAVT